MVSRPHREMEDAMVNELNPAPALGKGKIWLAFGIALIVLGFLGFPFIRSLIGFIFQLPFLILGALFKLWPLLLIGIGFLIYRQAKRG